MPDISSLRRSIDKAAENLVQLLVEKGYSKTSLGNDVLRTETVPLMIASILKYLKESDSNE